MTLPGFRRCALITGGIWLLASGSVPSSHPCMPLTDAPDGTPGNTVIQHFPPDGPMQTAWMVQFEYAVNKGLYIEGAWFKTTPDETWLPVLTRAEVSDIFVPYHTGDPAHRYYDMTGGYNFSLREAAQDDAGDCGRVIDTKVIHEVRPRGLMWKDDAQVRHGHELVLWGTFDAAFYNYIMSYAFRDDGTIALRVGATGRNHPTMPYEAHMHNTLWRIDVGLDDGSANSVYEAFHSEMTDQLVATDSLIPFNNGLEGALNWRSREFTELRVRGEKRNDQGKLASYDFRPFFSGTARHQESFTHSDFWVTRYRNLENHYKAIQQFVDGESVMDEDVVVWHMSSTHHEPRDEDGRMEANTWTGATLLMWNGIDLRPRNLFSSTPFFR